VYVILFLFFTGPEYLHQDRTNTRGRLEQQEFWVMWVMAQNEIKK
jgi:hypothetical protein